MPSSSLYAHFSLYLALCVHVAGWKRNKRQQVKLKQEKEIDHRKMNDGMKNGKQIHIVTNAHINKFHEICKALLRCTMKTNANFSSNIRWLACFANACHSFNFASLRLSTIVIYAYVTLRFAIRQPFNSDREKWISSTTQCLSARFSMRTPRNSHLKITTKNTNKRKKQMNFIRSSKWNYWDETPCQNDEKKNKLWFDDFRWSNVRIHDDCIYMWEIDEETEKERKRTDKKKTI